MMKISSITGAGGNMQPGSSGMQTDSVSRNIQNQIAAARKQLQEISSNQELDMEEKMKKRQEIQQEIMNLNQQLKQHQIEQRKEQQSKRASSEGASGSGAASKGNGSGLSKAGMQAMLSADSSMKQAKAQGSAATALKGRAGVLKAEIKQDAGKNTAAKEAELAEVEQKTKNVTASQMNTLQDVHKAVEKAEKAERSSASEDKDMQTGWDSKPKKSAEDKEDAAQKESPASDAAQETVLPSGYVPVDIRL